MAVEVQDLVDELKRDSSSGLVDSIVSQLVSMGFSAEIAHWAATTAEGASIEDRVNAALSMLS